MPPVSTPHYGPPEPNPDAPATQPAESTQPPEAAHATPQEPSAGAPASGYTPPGATPVAAPPAAPAGYVPPGASAGRSPAAPAARPQPATPEPPAPAPAPPDAPAAAPRRGPSRVALIAGGVLLLAVAVLVAAWALGAFAPRYARLPATAGAYALATEHQASGDVIAAATYRAGAGDVYEASLVRNAPDPAAVYAKAADATRLQAGAVYCTGVKAGKGATCEAKLPNGTVARVEGSTRHAAQEVASFTTTLAAGVR